MTPDILHHYRIERELADRLRRASKSERRHLYTEVYNELFVSVPNHCQVTKKKSATDTRETDRQFGVIRHLIRQGMVYLEVGAGDCALAKRVAQHVGKVYAVEVSNEIAGQQSFTKNLELVISDGSSIPVPASSVDLAYSNQLLEHLHPEDADEQLAQIHKALRVGGIYVCITPNALCGPHDISAHFDDKPTGLHLKEYSNKDLVETFRRAGFSRFKVLVSYRSVVIPALLPVWPFTTFENALAFLPTGLRKAIGRTLIAVKFVAIK
ncbi:MAG: hypothetical protein BGN91_11635 [Nitrobacter sp. 62-13]|uniref:class I SAM-dependent methyltransferase n=1 Tax=Nitrobacter sp. 62-13 TaxID=1895797 RepID=UPI000960C139|nr:class I SAM-dependent methyltransferase [Nitrobacter sp. 62-13]OJU25079.1 MAG: hypothetical protein BGN91_11635 [Nitrobacter sp. 62-13]